MKKGLPLIICLIASLYCSAQIRFVEFFMATDASTGTSAHSNISIKNFGNTAVDISNYWISANLNDYPITSFSMSSLLINPGESITINTDSILYCEHASNGGTDVSLYSSNNFSDPNAMIDFFQYGGGENGRENIAVAKGIWNNGDYIFGECSQGLADVAYPDNVAFQYLGDGTQYGLSYWSFGFSLSVVEELLNQTELLPNPVKDVLYLRPQTGVIIDKVEVYDLRGNKIKEFKEQTSLDMSELSVGIYVIVLMSENNKVAKKLVVI